ncbi:MAG: hypothetical protein GY830_04005 [Bacteroidetes bacterium]|nr:hypothetical protein [Bacteroidota bacterium]
MFFFDPAGNGSTYSNNDNINYYGDFVRINSRGSNNGYTPYSQKNLTTLELEINNAIGNDSPILFKDLSQKIIPYMYQFYDPVNIPTNVAKIEADHTITKVSFEDVNKKFNEYFGVPITIAKSDTDQLLEIGMKGQEGKTYAQKLAL